jgi:hypothetical protein
VGMKGTAVIHAASLIGGYRGGIERGGK